MTFLCYKWDEVLLMLIVHLYIFLFWTCLSMSLACFPAISLFASKIWQCREAREGTKTDFITQGLLNSFIISLSIVEPVVLKRCYDYGGFSARTPLPETYLPHNFLKGCNHRTYMFLNVIYHAFFYSVSKHILTTCICQVLL